ncbi:MAG: hypothetical protein RL385_2195 [Pseudomonadota bacterium]|jgi:hypothetical protein
MHYTMFLRFLTPSVFHDFLRTLGAPYAPQVFPQNLGPLHFEPTLDELVLYLVENP